MDRGVGRRTGWGVLGALLGVATGAAACGGSPAPGSSPAPKTVPAAETSAVPRGCLPVSVGPVQIAEATQLQPVHGIEIEAASIHRALPSGVPGEVCRTVSLVRMCAGPATDDGALDMTLQVPGSTAGSGAHRRPRCHRDAGPDDDRIDPGDVIL
jgi:hypothetical protein